ncbi:mucin-2-like isoform X3 [Scylla paramamosain]
MDSSRSPKKSPYHFRKHLNVRQSVLASLHGKSPLASHSKGSVSPATATSNSATSTQALQRGKSAKDVGRSKVSSRRRNKAEHRGSVCCFCGSAEDNTVLLGKMCHMRDFHVHYYCLLFSSGLPQNGEDNEGILGFLEEDIMREVLRGKKLSCSYCLRKGATIGCVEKKCKRTYHFPCGIKNNALCMFSNDYRSYCSQHREYQSGVGVGQVHQCPICLETLVADPKLALWAPCCQRNSWFHKLCLQMVALSAGYFFKCPLCNDKDIFLPEMKKQGIYVPEQDASWELEPNAFNELLERPIRCDADKCACPDGRKVDMDGTWWEVLLCNLCGSTGVHVRCGGLPFTAKSWTCSECLSTTGAVSDAPSDTPARSTRHCTRRAREAGDEGVSGDGDSASPKRIKLEKNKEPSPLEAPREDDATSVSPDTVLWELEELGEEVPVVLQHLKDRVRLAHARMKELRLTEREVVRAAQRISASAVTSGSHATPGQQPHIDRKASSPFSTTSHSQPSLQPPKLSLFKSQTLPNKGQLTLVGMHHSPAPASVPAAGPVPSPDSDQTDKPPCQTFSLDKAHLLALWRCALPVARVEEVLRILETVFTEREAEVAKAAITRASRHRPSPRATPSRRRTRAMQCTTSTTTPWKAWSTPQCTSWSPTVLQNKSQQPATLQSPTQHPAILQSPSQQSATLKSHSEQSATLMSLSQQPATPSSISQQSGTPCSWTFKTPCSESHEPITSHSESNHPRTPHSDVHQPDTQQDSSPLFIRVKSGLHWSDTVCSEAQHCISAQREVQESCVTATCHVARVRASEESNPPRSACRRLLLQPGTSITTRNSKTDNRDNKDSAGCEEGATGDTASDRAAPPSLAITVEDPATTTTTTMNDITTTTTSNSNEAAASTTLQMTSAFTASSLPPPLPPPSTDSSPPPLSATPSKTGLPPSSKTDACLPPPLPSSTKMESPPSFKIDSPTPPPPPPPSSKIDAPLPLPPPPSKINSSPPPSFKTESPLLPPSSKIDSPLPPPSKDSPLLLPRSPSKINSSPAPSFKINSPPPPSSKIDSPPPPPSKIDSPLPSKIDSPPPPSSKIGSPPPPSSKIESPLPPPSKILSPPPPPSSSKIESPPPSKIDSPPPPPSKILSPPPPPPSKIDSPPPPPSKIESPTPASSKIDSPLPLSPSPLASPPPPPLPPSSKTGSLPPLFKTFPPLLPPPLFKTGPPLLPSPSLLPSLPPLPTLSLQNTPFSSSSFSSSTTSLLGTSNLLHPTLLPLRQPHSLPTLWQVPLLPTPIQPTPFLSTPRDPFILPTLRHPLFPTPMQPDFLLPSPFHYVFYKT